MFLRPIMPPLGEKPSGDEENATRKESLVSGSSEGSYNRHFFKVSAQDTRTYLAEM